MVDGTIPGIMVTALGGHTPLGIIVLIIGALASVGVAFTLVGMILGIVPGIILGMVPHGVGEAIGAVIGDRTMLIMRLLIIVVMVAVPLTRRACGMAVVVALLLMALGEMAPRPR